MISFIASAQSYRRTNSRRALGYLLLLMIAYEGSVESVHSHGRVAPGHTDAAAICDSGGSHSSHTGHSHQIECSLCEFQQQLLNGLVHAPVYALIPSAQVAFLSTLTTFSSSVSTKPTSDRGPPLGSI